MMRAKTFFLLFALVFFLSGCALLQPAFETPEVRVTSFRMLPSEKMAPRFEIGLHVINPNRSSLKLNGLTYSVNLEGFKVLSGVANDLPVIAGYGEGDVIVEATADLVSSLGLLSELMQRPREKVSYDLNAKLDIGALLPSLRISQTGQIALVPPQK
jgi:LEA14-like dessication related protein